MERKLKRIVSTKFKELEIFILTKTFYQRNNNKNYAIALTIEIILQRPQRKRVKGGRKRDGVCEIKDYF